MGEQIGGHKCAVGVTANGNTVPVDVAEFVHRVDGGAGIVHQLFNKRIVRFLVAFANNRESGFVENGIPTGYPKKWAIRNWGQ